MENAALLYINKYYCTSTYFSATKFERKQLKIEAIVIISVIIN